MEIYHDKEHHSFYIIVEELKCVVDYDIFGEIIEIYHTYVPETHRGRGIAGELMEAISKYAIENNLRIKPTCSYAVSFYRKNFEKYRNFICEGSLENNGACRIKKS